LKPNRSPEAHTALDIVFVQQCVEDKTFKAKNRNVVELIAVLANVAA
jgi:hypothetical protein